LEPRIGCDSLAGMWDARRVVEEVLSVLITEGRMLRLRELWNRAEETYDLTPALEQEQLVNLWREEFLITTPKGLALAPGDLSRTIVRWVDEPLARLAAADRERPDAQWTTIELGGLCGVAPIQMAVGLLYRARYLDGTNGLHELSSETGLPASARLSFTIRRTARTLAERVTQEAAALAATETSRRSVVPDADRKEGLVVVDPKKVFVVHGRDTKARDATFALLRSLGLHPLEWEDAVSSSGSASPYNGEVVEAALAQAQAIVVVFSGDDQAVLDPRLRPNGDDGSPGLQPRPNVLLETGMALQKDRRRTVIIETSVTRGISDLDGLNTVRYARGQGEPEFRNKLVARLRTAGCEVNTNGSDWLSAGDFASAVAPVRSDPPPSPPNLHVEALRGMLGEAAQLAVGDEGGREKLFLRVESRIKKAFGPASDYLEKLQMVMFYRTLRVEGERPDATEWRDGQRQLANLLEVMVEDLGS
jgi:predicted nucleotide-binding protein